MSKKNDPNPDITAFKPQGIIIYKKHKSKSHIENDLEQVESIFNEDENFHSLVIKDTSLIN